MTIYFPVLRWKRGEQGALGNLSGSLKDQITPIFEFPPGCAYDDRKVSGFCDSASNDWGPELPFYLDLSSVDYEDAPRGAHHPALALLREAHRQGLVPIPIINIDIDDDLFCAFQQGYADGLFRNIALRITENEEDTAANEATGMVNEIGITNTEVDLIIDLRDISSGTIPAQTRILNSLVNQFGTTYRRNIFIAGAFPSQLENYVGTDDNGCIPRQDWRLWIQARRSPNLAHLLFGDYTTIQCEFREIPFRGAPKIKYTLENEWFVIKGHRPRQRENQHQNLALAITNSSFFRGAQHSFGERRIQQCADGSWGPGNPTSWVTNDINQHITFVVSQVSATLAP